MDAENKKFLEKLANHIAICIAIIFFVAAFYMSVKTILLFILGKWVFNFIHDKRVAIKAIDNE